MSGCSSIKVMSFSDTGVPLLNSTGKTHYQQDAQTGTVLHNNSRIIRWLDSVRTEHVSNIPIVNGCEYITFGNKIQICNITFC